MEPILPSRYRILERYAGHIPKLGKSSGEELNWAYRVEDSSMKNEFIAMFCKPSYYTIIDISIWTELKKKYPNLTWYYAPNGYISRTVQKDNTLPYTYLHQFVMKYSGHGKGQNSIDHIHGETELEKRLDNRLENLRITTQSVQNENRGKVSRHSNARQLPAGITELPKFIVYYKECYNKEKNLMREFFTVEGHPNLEGKRKATCKSNKVNIQTKLQEAKDIISKLENKSIQPVQERPTKLSQPQADSIHDQNILVVKPDPTPNRESTLYPAQWKISNIYRALVTNNTKTYLAYLQENNSQPDLEEKLASLSAAVKSSAKDGGELLIKTFIEDLRTARHNAHCYSKNDALLLREDRDHWNSQSVLRAFNANMLDKFKHHTEANTGESATDPIWSKRWTTFVESVSNETDVTKKKSLISNFLTAQRTKKYRKSKIFTDH